MEKIWTTKFMKQVILPEMSKPFIADFWNNPEEYYLKQMDPDYSVVCYQIQKRTLVTIFDEKEGMGDFGVVCSFSATPKLELTNF